MRVSYPHVEDNKVIGNVQYGVMIEHQGSLYLKVKKRSIGAGMNLDFLKGHSVLFNVKYGSLRQIPGDTPVTVLKTRCTAEVDNTDEQLKDYQPYKQHTE